MEGYMVKKKINPEIDLLKFLFSVVIVLYHSKYAVMIGDNAPLPAGYICVEFFFMVSGYFMAKSSEKFDSLHIGRSTVDYVINKLKPIYPYFIIAFLIAFAVRQTSFFVKGDYYFTDLGRSLISAIGEVMLLMKSGIEYGTIYNGPTWYIGAMFIAIGVLFPLLLKHRDWFLNVGSLIISIFLYGYACQAKKTLNYLDWSEFTTFSVIRAIAGICLGCFIFSVVSRINSKDIKIKKTGKAIFVLIEMIILLIIGLIMQYGKGKGLDFVSIIFFCFLCVIVFSGVTGIPDILPQKFCSFLGKASLLLYLNHRVVARVLNHFKFDISPMGNLLIYIAITVCLAFMCNIVVELCRKSLPKLKNLLFE